MNSWFCSSDYKELGTAPDWLHGCCRCTWHKWIFFCCFYTNPTDSLVSRTFVVHWLLRPTFATPWTAAFQASLSFTISWSLLKLMSIESKMTSNHLNLYHPLLLLPSIFVGIRVFQSPCYPRNSQESCPTHFKSIILWCSAFFMVQLSQPYSYSLLEKP